MKKLKILFFLLLCVQIAFAQESFNNNVSLKLQEITFGADNDNFFPVRRDLDTNFYILQGQPHWRIDYHDSIPIAYQSGTYAKVSVRFKLICPKMASRPSIYVRGKAIDEQGNVIFEISSTTAQITSQGQDTFATIRNIRADRRFGKDTIKYFRRLHTTWEFSMDRRRTWTNVEGRSSNETYVVWRKPVPEIGRGYGWGYKRHHSLFHIVCSAFHNHFISDSSAMINKVWSLFDRQYWIQDSINPRLYRKIDGLRLAYYRNYTDSATTTGELLKFGTGQCTSFGGLFRDMLRLQGTGDDYDDRYIWSFNPPDTIQLCALNRRSSRVPFRKIRFLVNNWTLRGRTDTVYNIYSTCIYNQMPDFMAVVTSDRRYGVDSMTYTRDANGINRHLTFSTSDNMGISGQNSKNPESAFSLHYGAKLGNKYYDPSYGVIYNNINDVYQYLSGWMYLDPRYVLLKEEALRKDLNLNGRIDDYYTYSLYHIGGVNAFLPFFR